MKADNELAGLVAMAKKKDPKAEAALFREFYPFVMQVALRYAGGTADAEEITANSFLKFFRYLESYATSKGTLHSWLKQITIHEAIDHTKAVEKAGSTWELGEDNMASAIDNTLVEQLDAAELLALIRTLSPVSQTVFNLFVMEGYGHKEIAARLKISEGTSKWHLNNARKKLQQAINTAVRS